MRILVIAALLLVADKSSSPPESGWSWSECQDANGTLNGLKSACSWDKAGACEAAAQLQADINDNCR